MEEAERDRQVQAKQPVREPRQQPVGERQPQLDGHVALDAALDARHQAVTAGRNALALPLQQINHEDDHLRVAKDWVEYTHAICLGLAAGKGAPATRWRATRQTTPAAGASRSQPPSLPRKVRRQRIATRSEVLERRAQQRAAG